MKNSHRAKYPQEKQIGHLAPLQLRKKWTQATLESPYPGRILVNNEAGYVRSIRGQFENCRKIGSPAVYLTALNV